MGQKVNPIVFRLGVSNPNLSSWFSDKGNYSHILSQDLEIRHFLVNLLKSKGILLRSCRIQRFHEKLILNIDLYFSYILSKQAKFFWARSLFKSIKKKYTKIARIKDIKNFAKLLDTKHVDSANAAAVLASALDKKKYITSFSFRKNFRKKKSFFSRKFCTLSNKPGLYQKKRLFFFLVLRDHNKDNLMGGDKIVSAIKKQKKSYYKNLNITRLNFDKIKRLFILRKFKYNFRHYFLCSIFNNNLFDYQSSPVTRDNLDLLELSKNLCTSIHRFSGLNEIKVCLFSNQLNYLSSFKFFQRAIYKDLAPFQRSRELQKYFVETVEILYFVFVSFGYGNAYLISNLLVFLLENTKKQVLIAKFLQKTLNVLFLTLPKDNLAIGGIKILIKGRFNKRRRTKKIVLQEGQISLQTIATPIDYYQTQATTLYGCFGIKVWISKSRNI